MSNPADVPLFAAAAVAAAAASLTAFGFARRCPPGWRWWMAALWLTAAGTALAALAPTPASAALAAPLLQQWPLVALIGLRRFHARQALPGRERTDALLLVASSLFAALGTLLLRPENLWLLSLSNLAVHLYAAAVLFLGPLEPEETPLQGLGMVMALVAFGPGLAVLPATELLTPLQSRGLMPLLGARALAAALGAIVLAFVVLALVFDRAERQLRESRRRLHAMASLDALTQMPNRQHFYELATQAIEQDPPGSTVLLLFNIDHFKQLNDHLSHAAGDRALRLVSASVLEHLRALDVAGRHGADEFVLLLRGTNTHDAVNAAQRILAHVQAHSGEAQLPTLSLSFGLVQVSAEEDLAASLRRAELALDEARRQGQSRAVTALGDERQPVFSESQRLGLDEGLASAA